MVKDFTEQKKQELIDEIANINSSTWSEFTDGLGDGFLHIGKWLGLIESDMENVKRYHQYVLDMNNTTADEIEVLFAEVYEVDNAETDYFEMLRIKQEIYNSKIKRLAEQIQPNFTISSAETIRRELYEYNERLYAVDSRLNDAYAAELEYAQKAAAIDAVKGVASSLIGAAVNIVSMPYKMAKNIVTGRPDKMISDTWSLVNGCFAVGSNLVALAVVGVSVCFKNCLSQSQQEYLMQAASEYGGAEGLADVAEAEKNMGNGKAYEYIEKGARAIDCIQDAHGLADAGVEFVKEPKKLLEFDMKFGYGDDTLENADMLEKYKDKAAKYQKIYNKYKKQAKIAESYKTLYEYLSCIFIEDENEAMDELTKKYIEKSELYDFLDDVGDYFEDIEELIE